jgi:hypothetical protein
VRCCSTGDYHSWFKKSLGSKPESLGSDWSPPNDDAIDEEWQEFCARGSSNTSGAASTSGRSQANATNNYGYTVEDSWDMADDAYTPFPGKGFTASGDSVGMELWSAANGLNTAAIDSSKLWNRVSQVYVILFGAGQTETEGIYSLRAVSGNEGLPVDTIIAFEDAEDAERYSGLLEATMTHVPKVSPIESKELLDFCADSGYNCRLEPRGSLLMPPDYNVGMTDWERSLRLREGHFHVLNSDPEPATLKNLRPALPYSGPTLMNQAGAYFPSDYQSLEELKARLERLLP